MGSSSLITDVDGNVAQHIEYIPYGEVFVEERNNSWSTPYKFNGKELDEETGLYYYGARYYDPRTSVWVSVDPLAEKYPSVSSYVYCHNNPVNRIDPDGKTDYKVNKKGAFYDASTFTDKVKSFFGHKDKNDRILMEGSNEEICTLPAGSIGKVDNSDKKTQFEIKSNKVAEKVFKVLSRKTEVEWARINHSKSKESSNTLINEHSDGHVSVAIDVALDYQKSGEKIPLLDHSHPIPADVVNSDIPTFNMSINVSGGPDGGDTNTAKLFPKTTMRVLNVFANKYEYYNNNGVYKKQDAGK